MITVFGASAAHAYDITLCAEIANDFDDAAIGDKWLPANGWNYVPLKGVRLHVHRYTLTYPSTYVSTEDVWAGDDGCATVTLSVASLYPWTVDSKSRVDDVTAKVFVDGTNLESFTPTCYPPGCQGSYHPTADATVAVRPPFEAPWRVLAAAGKALALGNLGVTDDLEYDTSAACCNSSNQFQSHPGNGTYRFLTTHETGHAMVRRLDGNQTPQSNYTALADEPPCDASANDDDAGLDNGAWAPEYESVALKEGWAQFYGAAVWNDREDSCDFPLWINHGDETWDFDLDDQLDVTGVAGTVRAVGCEGPPMSGLQSYVTSRDWLEDLLDEEVCTIATGTNYVGTSYDVTRYFWDMYTDEDVPLADLADLYVDASPHTWAAAAAYPLYWSTLPFVRLTTSAASNGYGDEHGRQANNGVDHGPTP